MPNANSEAIGKTTGKSLPVEEDSVDSANLAKSSFPAVGVLFSDGLLGQHGINYRYPALIYGICCP